MTIQRPFSFAAAVFVTLILTLALTVYYPKYKNSGTEATISWDVCGYYYYLPAFLIYDDAKQLSFTEPVMKQYGPSGSFDMAMRDTTSGSYVMRYSSGQALMYLPFFLVGHAVASSSGYPVDGFSKPYQMSIAFGSLIVCIVGFWLLRKLLLRRYDDATVAITLVCIGIGTNYLEYASITAAMTHGYLFTLYCLLLLATESFYRRPKFSNAAAIGLVVGFCALTRPTEIISAVIPLLWGLKFPLSESLRERVQFMKRNVSKVALAAFCTLAVGSIQLFYWHYATGKWLVYSYGSQKFSWLNPHTVNGIWSYNNGWLVYTPIMYAAIIGLVVLFVRRSNVALTCAVFTTVFVYVVFSWDVWWYGGSLGQRTMVQAYPVLSFAFAASVERIVGWKRLRYAFAGLALFLIYYNLWLVHQSHHGGLFKTGEMTRAYFRKTLLTYERNENDLKLLDTNEEFIGEPSEVKTIYTNTFETDATACATNPIEGNKSICLAPNQSSDAFEVPLIRSADWTRVYATFRAAPKEWDTYKMPRLTVTYYNHSEKLKDKAIRVNRLIDEGSTEEVFIDSRFPDHATRMTVQISNASPEKPTTFDLLRVETFNEN